MQTLVCRSTIARLVKVAAAFASPEGANIPLLAKELEVSTKSLRRDKEFLSDRIGLDLQCSIVPHPERSGLVQYRWKATNAAQVLPVIDTLGRMVL